MTKRIISLILALFLIAGIFDAYVFTAYANEEQTGIIHALHTEENIADSDHGDACEDHDHEYQEPVKETSVNTEENSADHNHEENKWDIDELKSLGYTGKNVKIAVLDTAITTEQIKLTDFIDYSNEIAEPKADNHGNKMARILTTEFGIAPDIALLSAVVLNQEGFGNYKNVVKAIDWAIERNVQIITMSFSGYEYSKALQAAVQRAEDHGILVVAAAGNNGKEESTYPGKFASVLSVGSVNIHGEISSLSNYGAEVDLYAPGEIVSDVYNETMYGTSVAAQHVAGLAAILWEVAPQLNNKELRYILKNSVDDAGCIDTEKVYQLLQENDYQEDVQVNIPQQIISNDDGLVVASADVCATIGHNFTIAATCTSAKKCSRAGCSVTSGSALGHDYSKVTKAATCTATGTKQCSRCTSTTSIAALGHSYGSTKVYTAQPTCTSTGSYGYKCNNCSTLNGPYSESALGHSYTIAATCTSAAKCSRCSATTGSALGHDYSKVTKAATCTATGTKQCSRCTSTTSIAALGHSYGSTKVYTAQPTCTSTGSYGYKCNNCSTLNGPYSESALGHDYSLVTKAATCTAEGTKKCSRCTSTTSIPKVAHNYGTTKVYTSEPTCTSSGSYGYKCNNCTALSGPYTESALGHNYGSGYIVTKQPTCTESGTQSQQCTRCQGYQNPSSLPALGHSWTIAATCTNATTCNRCYATSGIPLAHNYTTVTKAATCTAEGTKKCSGCTSTIAIPKTEHSYGSTFVTKKQPTCTEDGEGGYQCNTCTTINGPIKIDKLGHSYGSGYVVTKQPTCTESGTQSQQCTRCQGYGIPSSLPALGHSWTIAATCTNATTCSRSGCGATSGIPLAHTYTTVTKAATCTAEGTKKCSGCTSTIAIPKTDHIYGTKFVTKKEPTCTVDGEGGYQCNTCTTINGPVKIDKLGHSWTIAATCTNATTCSRSGCGATSGIPLAHTYTTVTKAATCTAEGTKKCSGCTSTIAIPKTDHIYGTKFVTKKEPTCTVDGEGGYQCNTCTTINGPIKIDKLGHNFSKDYTILEVATCTKDGIKSQKCTRCPDYYIPVTIIPAFGHEWNDKDICQQCGEAKDPLESPIITVNETNGIKVVSITSKDPDVKIYCTIQDLKLVSIFDGIYKNPISLPQVSEGEGYNPTYRISAYTEKIVNDEICRSVVVEKLVNYNYNINERYNYTLENQKYKGLKLSQYIPEDDFYDVGYHHGKVIGNLYYSILTYLGAYQDSSIGAGQVKVAKFSRYIFYDMIGNVLEENNQSMENNVSVVVQDAYGLLIDGGSSITTITDPNHIDLMIKVEAFQSVNEVVKADISAFDAVFTAVDITKSAISMDVYDLLKSAVEIYGLVKGSENNKKIFDLSNAPMAYNKSDGEPYSNIVKKAYVETTGQLKNSGEKFSLNTTIHYPRNTHLYTKQNQADIRTDYSEDRMPCSTIELKTISSGNIDLGNSNIKMVYESIPSDGNIVYDDSSEFYDTLVWSYTLESNVHTAQPNTAFSVKFETPSNVTPAILDSNGNSIELLESSSTPTENEMTVWDVSLSLSDVGLQTLSVVDKNNVDKVITTFSVNVIEESNNIIKDVSELQNGARYRLRNAGSGKYLKADTATFYQYDYDPNDNDQIFTFWKNGDYIELESSYGNIGADHTAFTIYLTPNHNSGLEIIPDGTDGAMKIFCIGMSKANPYCSPMFYITAHGNQNGTNDIWGTNVDCQELDNSDYNYQNWYFEKVVKEDEESERPVLGSGYYTFDMPELSPYFQFDGDWVFNGGERRPQATGDTCTFSFYGDGFNIIYDLPYGMLELNIDGQGWNQIDTFVAGYSIGINDLTPGLHTVSIRYPGIESSNPMSYGSTDFVITGIDIF